MPSPLKLHYREYGSYAPDRPTLVLLHGLLGSSSNWHSIARQLEVDYHILVPDLRNHGRSPHDPDASYQALSGDLLELLDEHGLDQAILVGHSMGGKTAMLSALEQGERVEALVVVDIAPVNYHNRFGEIFPALAELDLKSLKDRNQADDILAQRLPERSLRQYLLQNLAHGKSGWLWRMNLDALVADMAKIIAFPELSASRQYTGPTLFLHGGNSDYLKPEYEPGIRARFPYARLRAIAGAGHWVYAEKPAEFIAALRHFLSSLER